MEEVYDFAIDTNKMESLINTVETEKNNMDDSVTNIFKTLEEMGNYWEGDTYNIVCAQLTKYQKSLESSVSVVDEIIKLLKANNDNNNLITDKIKGMVSKE